MNIVHLVSNKVWGGGERYVLDLCRRSADAGHSVAVITRGSRDVDAPFAAAGFIPGHLPLRGALDFFSPIVLARVLNRMSAPIVIHVHNFKDAYTAVRARDLMAHRADARVVVTRHLVKAAKDSSMERQLYRSVDEMIFVSEAARQAFLSGRPGCDETKLHVVHNSIIPPGSVDRISSEDDKVRLLYIGRISPEKGVDVLVDAMTKLSDLPVHLTVAGMGRGKDVLPLMRECRNSRIDDRVEWVGHIDNVYGAIAKADIGILPTRVPEAFGLSALEFISQGVPVVASASGGPLEIFTDGTDGFLVEPGNAAALAQAIRRLVTDAPLRDRMGRAARDTFDSKFGYTQFLKKIIEIYEGAFTREH